MCTTHHYVSLCPLMHGVVGKWISGLGDLLSQMKQGVYRCKSWTLDSGLDRGLDYGLEYELNSRLIFLCKPGLGRMRHA